MVWTNVLYIPVHFIYVIGHRCTIYSLLLAVHLFVCKCKVGLNCLYLVKLQMKLEFSLNAYRTTLLCYEHATEIFIFNLLHGILKLVGYQDTTAWLLFSQGTLFLFYFILMFCDWESPIFNWNLYFKNRKT